MEMDLVPLEVGDILVCLCRAVRDRYVHKYGYTEAWHGESSARTGQDRREWIGKSSVECCLLHLCFKKKVEMLPHPAAHMSNELNWTLIRTFATVQ